MEPKIYLSKIRIHHTKYDIKPAKVNPMENQAELQTLTTPADKWN